MRTKLSEKQILTHDGLKLYCQSWITDAQEKGLVILLHGLGEHSGRYAHLGRFLAERGYSVNSFDLRGHGKSEGKRGDTPSCEAYLKDIDKFILSIPDIPDRPCFIYGHSLGAILAISYVLSRNPPLNGAICTGLALNNALETQKFKLSLVKILGRSIPHLIIPSGLDPNALSRDPEIVSSYINDPLVHDRASLGFALEMIKEIASLWEKANKFPEPLLLMHGEKDQVAYPSSSSEFARQVEKNCTLKIWENMFHEIHNEIGKEMVFEYLLEWLNKRTVGTPTTEQS
jgi:alpha-beta hydrolase superfamily lysophospholipase